MTNLFRMKSQACIVVFLAIAAASSCLLRQEDPFDPPEQVVTDSEATSTDVTTDTTTTTDSVGTDSESGTEDTTAGSCQSDDDCSCTGDGVCLYCVGNECVECGVDEHCIGNEDGVACSTEYECVECVNNDGCSNGNVCSAENKCVECVSNADCSDGNVCSAENECVECLEDDHCTGNSNDKVCSASHECVECVVDDDCSGNGNGEACSASHECVECVTDEHCLGNGNGGACDGATHECVTCTANSDDACQQDNNKYCNNQTCGHPESCSDLRDWGYEEDGVYWLDFCGDGTTQEYDCLLDPDGPDKDFGVGWTKVEWSDVWGCADPSEHDTRLFAVDEGTDDGVDSVVGPFAEHDDILEGDATFSYLYTFPLPAYNAFFFEDYTVRFSTCYPGNCKINATGQSSWDENAYTPGSGTVIFGSDNELAINITEKTDADNQPYAAAYNNADTLVLNSTANAQGDQLGIIELQQSPATSFRIAWGESGADQLERISVWRDGAIWFRRSP